jgi:hypothetical protein
MGVFHNLSVDIVSIQMIVETRCISAIIHSIRSTNTDICSAAIGTLINLIRDPNIRVQALDMGVLDGILETLCHEDVDCQIAALSAWMALIGEQIEENEKGYAHTLLADVIALSAINSCIR